MEKRVVMDSTESKVVRHEDKPLWQTDPFTAVSRGVKVTFRHASDFAVGTLHVEGSVLAILISCPEQTNQGMFITLSPDEAIELAESLIAGAKELRNQSLQ
jgi:hypothetical protein